MTSWLSWISDEVKKIPGQLVDDIKTDVSNAASSAWNNIRTDAANAVNQLGAAGTSQLAGGIAPSGSRPVSIPLSSGQLVAVAGGIAVLIAIAVYTLTRR
jgi:hypothetical protein